MSGWNRFLKIFLVNRAESQRVNVRFFDCHEGLIKYGNARRDTIGGAISERYLYMSHHDATELGM